MPSLPRGARCLLLLLILASLTFAAAAPLAAQSPEPDAVHWIKVADQAAWAPRDSCGEVVFKNRMWLLGGWLDSYSDGPRDVWSSADGKLWKLELKTAPWKHADLPMTVVFNDRMWLMGGWHGGRLAHASASNQVWSSADGVKWTAETDSAGWSPRLGAAVVSFKNRMWILGGIERYYDGGPEHLKNDVWSSADGARWDQAVASAQWSPRAYHGAVVHDGKIWLFAGGNYLPGYAAFNDVWNSADGVHWNQVTEHAPWSPRIWFSFDTYRDRMWILGGWSNNPSRNWNDVWHSRDGKNWTELKTDTVWEQRHEQSAYVFDDRLWIVGGNAWPLKNDVWQLALPANWSPK